MINHTGRLVFAYCTYHGHGHRRKSKTRGRLYGCKSKNPRQVEQINDESARVYARQSFLVW